jgi:hypothetical protein
MAGLRQPGVSPQRVAPLAVMPAAAVAVHQLRYWLAFHGMARIELARQGHAYLHSAAPWIALLAAVSVGAFLRGLGDALGGRRSLSRHTLPFLTLWGVCVAALLAIYMAQEALEGLMATGHPTGWAGIFGYGGWWSIPAALCVGLVVAAAFYGAQRVLACVAAQPPAGRSVPTAPPLPRFTDLLRAPRLVPVAGGWTLRGPPRRA